MKLIDSYSNSDSWGWGPSFNIYQLDSEDENLDEFKNSVVVARDVNDPTRIIVCYNF